MILNKMVLSAGIILATIGIIWIIVVIIKIGKNTKPANKYKPSLIKRLTLLFTPITYKSNERGSLERTFAQALKTLSAFIQGKNFKYKLPWFLMFGPSGSGKSTFLNSLLLESPIDEDPLFAGKTQCDWRFFNNGIFLDLKGSLVKNPGIPPTSEEKDWFKFLDLLSESRPRKPLDGIVFVVSSEDLVGEKAKNNIQLHEDAEYLYAKLWQLQRVLKVKLPVYFIITHLDKIDGFKAFARALPQETKEDIFGWSSPYAPESLFKEDWITEMFTNIETRIREIQSEIFVTKTTENDSEILLFPANFYQLEKPLKTYLSRLFQKNTYTEGFFLRGVFCVGSEHQELALAGQIARWPELPNNDGSKEMKITLSPVRHVFATQLVVEKIFLEKNMGRIIWNNTFSYSTSVKLLQLSIVGGSIIGTAGLLKSYKELDLSNVTLTPYLYRINQIIKTQHNEKNKKTVLLKETDLLLKTISDISTTGLYFPFLPASWFSRIDNKVQQLLQESYDFIILQSISEKLKDKFKELANGKIDNKVTKNRKFFYPTDSKAFENFRRFVRELNNLEKATNKLEVIKNTASLEDFAWVVKIVLGIDLPKRFYKKATIYKEALQKSTFETTNYLIYRTSIQQQAQDYFNGFIKQGFLFDNVANNIEILRTELTNLQRNQLTYTSFELQSLLKIISTVITQISSEAFSWLSNYEFKTRKFKALIEQIGYTNTLGPEIAEHFKKKTNETFQELRSRLRGIIIPIVGPIFGTNEGRFLEPSLKLIELQGIINTLFAESFMEPIEKKNLEETQSGKRLIWNLGILNKLLQTFATFEKFYNSKIMIYPEDIREAIRAVTKNSLETHIRTKLADAQQFIFDDSPGATMLDEIQNIRLGSNFLPTILRQLKALNLNTYITLKDRLKSQAVRILNQLDKMLEDEDLYKLAENEIKLDRLIKGVPYSQSDINEYLANQRGRVEYFAKELVEPVLNILTFIDQLENAFPSPLEKKWSRIIQDLENYKQQNKISQLEHLEKFVKEDVANMSLETLSKLSKETSSIKLNKDDYFANKLASIKLTLSQKMDELKKSVMKTGFDEIFGIFKEIAYFYPFNPSGPTITTVAAQKLNDLIKQKDETIKTLKLLKQDQTNNYIKFFDKLDKLAKWITYITTDNEKLVINFGKPNEQTKGYEKNTGYLISVETKTPQTSIQYPKEGQLIISDTLTFKFKLAEGNRVKFVQLNNENTYQASDYEAKCTYTKKDLMNLILKYGIEVNGTTILRIAIPIIDEEGKTEQIIFALPITMLFQGAAMPFLELTNLKIPTDEKEGKQEKE